MTWKTFLDSETSKEYFQYILKTLQDESVNYEIFPPKELIFNAFNITRFENVKVVLLGMDPYINPGQAEGLSFSVPNGMSLPPSLKNIFKEFESDLQIRRTNGNLKGWAEQGCLLLNAALTVRRGESGSHSKLWERFTDQVIIKLNESDKPLVFILWGNHARAKKKLISNHFVIESAHPSPLSAHNGFFGSKPFSKTNNQLKLNNLEEIDWSR